MITILSKIYNFFAERRNRKFDEGKKLIVKLDIPVISVGNLSVGGTGKTPFVIFLVKLLKSQGKRPGVIGRGYGRKSKIDIIVSDGKTINENTDECGDEMVLIAQKTKVPVMAGKKKWSIAKKICKEFDLDLLIVDDGFQHRYLHRDLDILLIDEDTVNKPFALPKGRLREKFENYKRADIIALKGVTKFNGNFEKIILYKNEPKKLINVFNYSERSSYGLISSIAKPNNFIKLVEFKNINYEFSLIFKDHYRYSKEDVLKIFGKCKQSNVNTILTTEKDTVKLIKFKDLFKKENINLVTFPIETEIERKEILIKELAKLYEKNT